MEFLFELLFEIIVEGAVEVGTSRKVPLILRVLALLVFLTVFGGLAILLFVAGAGALQDGQKAAGVILLAVALGLIFGSVYMVVKKMRK